MADQPDDRLGGITAIEKAYTPYMDRIAALGSSGLLHTVPPGFTPGSEIANLSLLGYDVRTDFEGRGSLEAASMGVEIPEGWMAMRCNLICTQDGRIKNHSAGHISNEQAYQLIAYLNEQLADENVRFYPGVSYRHLLLIRNGDKRIVCTPPHDVPNALVDQVMIAPQLPMAAATAELLNRLIIRSQELLALHPINIQRSQQGHDMASSIWPWSPGYKPKMQTLMQKFGIASGSVISAVDLIKGIGVYAGLRSIDVEGATGLFDTNYEGKAAAAIEALRHDDFVFVHIEASDEASHEGDVELKVVTIENLDERIIAPIWKEIQGWQEPVTMAILPDHPTPCALRTHTSDPVPFIIYKPHVAPDSVMCYSECAASEGGYGILRNDEFIKTFFRL